VLCIRVANGAGITLDIEFVSQLIEFFDAISACVVEWLAEDMGV
jgi:hypothetical protein